MAKEKINRFHNLAYKTGFMECLEGKDIWVIGERKWKMDLWVFGGYDGGIIYLWNCY